MTAKEKILEECSRRTVDGEQKIYSIFVNGKLFITRKSKSTWNSVGNAKNAFHMQCRTFNMWREERDAYRKAFDELLEERVIEIREV